MIFKVKILDTLHPLNPGTIVTFFDQDNELHSSLNPGDRVRLLNVTPAANSHEQLQLNFVKTSKVIHLTDCVLRPKKLCGLVSSYKALAEKHASVTLADFKRRFND
jgi:hypothetical protein